MSYALKTGETVNLNRLAARSAITQTLAIVREESNVEKVRKYNDLTALHILIRVKGV